LPPPSRTLPDLLRETVALADIAYQPHYTLSK
jgi:hypothetical protein